MSITTCTRCGSPISWEWEEAFDKFGFNEGDGTVMTETVADELRKAGYEVRTAIWGMHNTVITAIFRDGKSIIPDGVDIGYDDPRHYLPEAIVELLDHAFLENAEVRS